MNRLWFLLLLGIDIASKWLCIQFLPPYSGVTYPYGGVAIFENILGISFSLNYVMNTGAAWGLFQGYGPVLFIFRLLIIGSLMLYLFKQKSTPLPFYLVLTGAVGNVIDYFLYGHVIDLFHFVLWGYSFPLFNVADASIFCGVMGLLLFPKKRSPETAP